MIALYIYNVKLKHIIHISFIRFFSKSFCNFSCLPNKIYIYNHNTELRKESNIFRRYKFFFYFTLYTLNDIIYYNKCREIRFQFTSTIFHLDSWGKNLIFRGLIFLIIKMGKIVSAT